MPCNVCIFSAHSRSTINLWASTSSDNLQWTECSSQKGVMVCLLWGHNVIGTVMKGEPLSHLRLSNFPLDFPVHPNAPTACECAQKHEQDDSHCIHPCISSAANSQYDLRTAKSMQLWIHTRIHTLSFCLLIHLYPTNSESGSDFIRQVCWGTQGICFQQLETLSYTDTTQRKYERAQHWGCHLRRHSA